MDDVAQWRTAQDRVITLVQDLDAEQAATPVPACPDWSVRDLLSHVVGLGVDVLAGDEPDDHDPAWTARHVERRRDRDVAALLDEWRRTTEPLSAWMDAHGARPLGDLVIHEADLRGALGAPPVEDEGVETVRDRMAGRVGPRVAQAGLPAIALVSPTWEARLGEGEAAVVLEAPAYDLFRALVSRRSAAQLRSWTVRGDVGPYLEVFTVLGPLPEVDLTV